MGKSFQQPFAGMPIRKILWMLMKPVRVYITSVPLSRGKGFLLRNVVIPVLPGDGASFLWESSSGNLIRMRYRETLGRDILMNRGFEEAERQSIYELARTSTTAIDVGANIGIVTLDMARAVGPDGSVLAVEPILSSADRLRENLRLNSVENVSVHVLAAGETDGYIEMRETSDSAFNTSLSVADPHLKVTATEQVEVAPLDSVWAEAGYPGVSFVKIDVEGAEMGVLRGATELLDKLHPALMIEANTPRSLQELVAFLSDFGYTYSQPEGYMPWNYLFAVR